ncbi:unnamed protein product [Rotaria magnacalcarata]|uniref:Uncharacterized protein n=1 Tax=Rotaria magnacalcarata TaxID=392030 RepID=A0A816PTQ5_9BILA|nr:unnamed protein product [Rotaria magnacalcarata]CAF2051729.1 unnamed protein product [Rotaria magnacalcarata]CAF5065130.1 unnamed protein product [Rotaria magnacalcarata]CAF5177896.1 unnamed protein product [Rotaria magnacalcarata]
MASASSHGLRKSKRTAQVVQVDQSFYDRQSRKTPMDSSASGVKNGGISRRRSAPGSRYSRGLQTQSKVTTAQRSTSNSGGHIRINDEGDDEDENVDQYIDQLNISSTSTATENMEVSQQHDEDHPIASIDSNNQNRRTIKKNELLNQHFTKLNTGGYYCKLCVGSKNSNKVRLYTSIS